MYPGKDLQKNRQTRPRWIRLLGSLKLTITLLAVFAIAIATATFLEGRYGTTGARVLVYNARWFEIVLALLVVNLLVSLFSNMPYRKHQTGFVVTHAAFVVVLVSAGITRYFGYEGTVSIREGASTDFAVSTKEYIQLTSGDETASFAVQLFKPGRNHIQKTLSAGGARFDVTVTDYWPHCETRWIDKPGGSPAVVYSMAGTNERREVLPVGQTTDISGVTVRFMKVAKTVAAVASPRGALVVGIAGRTHELAVPESRPAEIEAAGYRFRITEFSPDFRVGDKPDPSAPMNNPAIRVHIAAPNGDSGERLLFAFHPDFDMGHSGTDEAFSQLDLVYRYDRNLTLFPDGTGQLSGTADFDIVVESESVGDPEVAANQTFTIKPGMLLRAGAFSFLVRDYLQSAVESPTLSNDVRQPAAVRVVVADGAGNEADAIVRRRDDPVDLPLGATEIALRYGPIRIALPYSLYLDDFALVTYPGSENPASFESHVRIFDEERGVDGRPAVIYMNHPLDYRGFKHFQSSYDQDRKGTILSINHDPGKRPTYFGYTLVGLGFLVTLTRGLLWNRNPAKRGE